MWANQGNFIPTRYNLPPPPPPSSQFSSRGKPLARGGGRGRGRGKFYQVPTYQQTSRPVVTPNNPQKPNGTVSFSGTHGDPSIQACKSTQQGLPSHLTSSFVHPNPECERAAQAAFAATSSLLYKNNKNNANVVENKSSSIQGPSIQGSSNQGPSNQGPPRCENCRTTFDSVELLKIHVTRHRKCPQCDFRATLSNIREHQFDAHGVGRVFKDNDESALKPKMNFMLDTPEAIAIWIEERKKRYPTDANIAKKKLAEVKRIARGDVIDAEKRKTYDGRQSIHAFKKFMGQDKMQIIINDDKPKKVGGVSGISDFAIAAAAAGVDHETKTERDAVSDLMLCVEKIRSRSEKAIERLYSQICIKYMPGHCPRGKDCGNRHKGSMICPPLQRAPDSQRVRSKNLRDMLLYKEKVQEKNAILQSLRYITDNDFFGVASNKTLQGVKNRRNPAIMEVDKRSG